MTMLRCGPTQHYLIHPDLTRNTRPIQIHSIQSITNCQSPTIREAFTKAVVLQSNMLSLQMVPLQSYELSEHNTSNPTPVGHLASPNCVKIAGRPEDWKFLEQPDAKQYIDSAESIHDLFTGERLDLWTQLMLKLLGRKQSEWNQPHGKTAITIPKYQKELPKIQLYGTNIMVPTEDEVIHGSK
ncbi:hypothetical protein THRCLA_10588 [Thraustotheca clavata]|uniref:Uncharacterized protein n=1 Tax=Thraustotheca clavata TaxID=74557 RepID=A0A1V9YJX2_9STRA|nr:hypothetical protein THRCLA_10588 [Thraustotheca clavata]